MKTKEKEREIFVRIEKKEVSLNFLAEARVNLAVRAHWRIKEASISLCRGSKRLLLWLSRIFYLEDLSSFIRDCKGKKNESLGAEVLVSLCFDIVTPHQLLKKSVHTRSFVSTKLRDALLKGFQIVEKYEH